MKNSGNKFIILVGALILIVGIGGASVHLFLIEEEPVPVFNAFETYTKFVLYGEIQLIDVRDNLSSGYINGTLFAPISCMSCFLDAIRDLPKNATYVTYCETGVTSLRAARELINRGYDTYSMYGGIEAWKSLGFSVEYPER